MEDSSYTPSKLEHRKPKGCCRSCCNFICSQSCICMSLIFMFGFTISWLGGATIMQVFNTKSSTLPEASSCVPPLNNGLYSGIKTAFQLVEKDEGFEPWYSDKLLPDSENPSLKLDLWFKDVRVGKGNEERIFMKLMMNITYFDIDPQTIIEATVREDVIPRWDKRTIERLELGDSVGKIPDVVDEYRPQNGSVDNPALVYEAKQLPLLSDADIVFVMANEFVEIQGMHVWAFAARGAAGYSTSILPLKYSEEKSRQRKYDDKINVFMWKNGDHTQVFSIIEIELPFSMNAFTKPSAKKADRRGACTV